MSQVLLTPEDRHGDRFVLRGEEAHHLANVLRKKIGEEIVLFDGSHRFRAVLTDVASDRAELQGRILKERGGWRTVVGESSGCN